MKTETDFGSFKVASLPPKEILHPRITDPVWRAFMRGEFDVAAFQAMKAVELSVRAAAGLSDNLIGVKLMREAFALEAGPLTDTNAEGGERVGRMELFAHIPKFYRHTVRHFGLLAPRRWPRVAAAIFTILGTKQRPRTKRLPWAVAVQKVRGNPLLDRHSQPMKFVRHVAASAL
jgi:uncharacterized protein (TIGR02391 family)